MDAPAELVLRPIGVVRTPFDDRRSAPRQPRAGAGVRGTIELFPGRHFDVALSDLAGWEFIWVLFWFHHNPGWRPKVLPPRSDRRRGVFATRSPHRPNPLGLSAVRLEAVTGLVLQVSDLDMLDGTPVLDLKPYVPWADAIPNARTGWLAPPDASAAAADAQLATDALARPRDPRPGYEVVFVAPACEQLAFLRAHGVELEAPVRDVLALGPHPHPYRRIKPGPDGTAQLALKEWRLRFRAEGRTLTVFAVATGYRPQALADDTPALAVHRAFVARWGQG